LLLLFVMMIVIHEVPTVAAECYIHTENVDMQQCSLSKVVTGGHKWTVTNVYAIIMTSVVLFDTKCYCHFALLFCTYFIVVDAQLRLQTYW